MQEVVSSHLRVTLAVKPPTLKVVTAAANKESNELSDEEKTSALFYKQFHPVSFIEIN